MVKPIYNQYTLQTLATGDRLTIDSYTFNFNNPGPTIYLQANLHGAEITGVVILKKVIKYLKENPLDKGKITIVPCANPIGVNDKSYAGISGRFNSLDGKNWNRIFDKENEWSSLEEGLEYCKNGLKQEGSSIESRLSYILKLLSFNADYLIDIHTSGVESIPYLFTHKGSHKIFSPLKSNVHIELTKQDAGEAFEDSHYINYSKIKEVHACTWEVGTHNVIDKKTVEKREKQLVDFLNSVADGELKDNHSPNFILPINNKEELFAPCGGYYVWKTPVGKQIKSGDCMAKIYHPHDSETSTIKSEDDCILISKDNGHAFSQGESIGTKVVIK